jgi:ligand-binding sensor domain-containing protein
MNILLPLFFLVTNSIAAPGYDYAFSRGEITAIARMGTEWWVATFDGGVVALDDEFHIKREITAADGLPSVHATALAPDGNGGVWIGTIAGPAHWTPDGKLDCPTDFAGLRTSDVNALTMVGDKLWIATNEGVRLADPHYAGKPAWDRLPGAPELESAMKEQWGEVPRLLEINKKTGKPIPKATRLYLVTPAGTVLDDLYSVLWDGSSLWLGGAGRLFRYIPADDHWQTFPLPKGNEARLLTALAELDGNIYMGTDSGMFRMSLNSNGEDKVATTSIPAWDISTVLSDDNKLLLGCDHGIYHYTPAEDTYYCLRLPPPQASRVTALAKCDRGWLAGSDAGLWLYPGDWISAEPQPINLGGTLPRSDVWALAPAVDGVWLATGKGLARWHNGEAAPQTVDILSCRDGCRALLADGDALWVANKTGLIKMNANDPTPKPLQVKPLAQKNITVLAAKSGGGIWAAGGNVIYPLEEDGRLTHAFMLPSACERITDLWQDGTRLYAGTWGMGVVALDSKTGRILQIYDDSYALGSNLIYCIRPLAPGRMLVGQQDAGLDVVELTSGEPLWHLSSWEGLGSSDILTVMEEPGEIWIGARAGGLNRMDKMDGKIESITSRAGLGDSYIKDILRSGDHVYLATGGGCVRLNSPRKAGIVEYWGKEKSVETIKPKGKKAAKEVTFAMPGMPETNEATPAHPVKINQ